MATLEIKKSPDGRIMARRTDRRPLTPEDMEAARRLAQAESCASEEKASTTPRDDDPLLSPGEWYLHFTAFVTEVYKATPDFDLAWLRNNRTDLYQQIRAIEDQIDRLQEVRLSEIMSMMREWRTLILRADFELRKDRKTR